MDVIPIFKKNETIRLLMRDDPGAVTHVAVKWSTRLEWALDHKQLLTDKGSLMLIVMPFLVPMMMPPSSSVVGSSVIKVAKNIRRK